ncbi:MAG: hypothetical protein HQK84_10305 [Nitrospinae bacterium]|nr:hypothetical protein [Nitrospinota bacterium]
MFEIPINPDNKKEVAKLLQTIETLQESIGELNDYLTDLKIFLLNYEQEPAMFQDIQKSNESEFFKLLPPISEDEMKNLNIEDLLSKLIKKKTKE